MSSERKPPPPDDRELEDFLAGKHPVGRAYREVSEQETAPRELDDAILRMAREHAAPKADGVPLRRRPRWLQPLAVAATLALSLGVLMNIWRDPTLREQVAPTQAEEEKEGATPQTPPAPPASSSSSQPAPAPSAPAMAEPIEEVPAPEPSRADELAAPALESRRAEPFPEEGAGAGARGGASSPADAMSPSTVSPRAGAAVAPAPPAPPPPPSSPAASAMPVPAPEAGAAAQSRPSLDFRALERDPVDDAAARAEEKAARKALADDAAGSADAERAKKEQAPPRETLVEQARAALVRGDADEARRLVAQLRRLYPETPLPEDLRMLGESDSP